MCSEPADRPARLIFIQIPVPVMACNIATPWLASGCGIVRQAERDGDVAFRWDRDLNRQVTTVLEDHLLNAARHTTNSEIARLRAHAPD
jgi:hypothetical protein